MSRIIRYSIEIIEISRSLAVERIEFNRNICTANNESEWEHPIADESFQDSNSIVYAIPKRSHISVINYGLPADDYQPAIDA